MLDLEIHRFFQECDKIEKETSEKLGAKIVETIENAAGVKLDVELREKFSNVHPRFLKDAYAKKLEELEAERDELTARLTAISKEVKLYNYLVDREKGRI